MIERTREEETTRLTIPRWPTTSTVARSAAMLSRERFVEERRGLVRKKLKRVNAIADRTLLAPAMTHE